MEFEEYAKKIEPVLKSIIAEFYQAAIKKQETINAYEKLTK